jgi:Fic family protein
MLRAAPQAVRDYEADLGRLSGRLSHLFTMNYKLALEHRAEIHAALNEVRGLRREMREAVAALQAEIAEPRAEIVRVLRCVNTALNA